MPHHFRDRVILPITGQNIPQLPSARRAVANVPMLTTQAVLVVAPAINIYTINLSQDLATVITTQTTNATSP